MIAWRITHTRNIENALSGEGAYRFPGRWNRFGVPMVYSASTASLAILEYVAHVNPNVARPRDLILLQIELSNDITLAADTEFPSGWNAIPPIDATRIFGATWARSQTSLCLAVPSVVVPTRSEFNILINPLHRDMHLVTIKDQQPFSLDPRMVTDAS